MAELTLTARTGRAVPLPAGSRLRVVNRHGGQVVDMWAVNAEDPAEWLSMEHTRTSLSRLVPAVGDALYSLRRRPMLTLVQDTSPGVHDTLLAACDAERYRQLGAEPGHANCAENLRRAAAEHGIEVTRTPSPLNLFMNIPWDETGQLAFHPSPARAGDEVILEATMPCIVVLSACPMDLNPINAGGLNDIGVEVLEAS